MQCTGMSVWYYRNKAMKVLWFDCPFGYIRVWTKNLLYANRTSTRAEYLETWRLKLHVIVGTSKGQLETYGKRGILNILYLQSFRNTSDTCGYWNNMETQKHQGNVTWRVTNLSWCALGERLLEPRLCLCWPRRTWTPTRIQCNAGVNLLI